MIVHTRPTAHDEGAVAVAWSPIRNVLHSNGSFYLVNYFKTFQGQRPIPFEGIARLHKWLSPVYSRRYFNAKFRRSLRVVKKVQQFGAKVEANIFILSQKRLNVSEVDHDILDDLPFAPPMSSTVTCMLLLVLDLQRNLVLGLCENRHFHRVINSLNAGVSKLPDMVNCV